MDMKTSEVILQVAAEIEAELNKQSVPGPNDFIPRRIQFLAAQLSGRDRYAAEKAYRIADLAGTFYSARKHSKYPGGHDALWTEMTYSLLGRIKDQASLWKEKGE